MSSLEGAFHRRCVSDVHRTLGRTCVSCLSRAARSKNAGETVRGYLERVAETMGRRRSAWRRSR